MEAIRRPGLSSGLMAMSLVVATELMMFSGFISSYLVARAGIRTWPPLGQPRLPVEATAVNTLILLLSGLFFWLSFKSAERRVWFVRASAALGAVFILVQGSEWRRLIHFGLTTTSSLYGSYFYLIIGAHALHALIGVVTLIWFAAKFNSTAPISSQRLISSHQTIGLYWSFVVLLWPVLYVLVYLI